MKRIRAERVIHSLFSDKPGTPAYILPATAEAYEQMVDQIAELIFVPLGSETGETNRRAALYLRAIGITAPQKKGMK